MGFGDGRGQRTHPTFGFEFEHIVSPNLLVQVATTYTHNDRSPCWNRNFVHSGTISTDDWLRDRHYDILLRPDHVY